MKHFAHRFVAAAAMLIVVLSSSDCGRRGGAAEPTLQGKPRVSFPMAVSVWEEELLEVLPGLPNPKYPPIKAITFRTRTASKFYGDAYAGEDPKTT